MFKTKNNYNILMSTFIWILDFHMNQIRILINSINSPARVIKLQLPMENYSFRVNKLNLYLTTANFVFTENSLSFPCFIIKISQNTVQKKIQKHSCKGGMILLLSKNIHLFPYLLLKSLIQSM